MEPKDILTNKGDKISPWRAEKYSEECEAVLKEWPSLATWAYCSLHNIPPRCCIVCSAKLPVKSLSVGYDGSETYCSRKCTKIDKPRAIKEAMMRKYGVANPSNVPEFREKRKVVFLEKYGTVSPLANKEVRERIKKTNLEKYGVECPAKNHDVKMKASEMIKESWRTRGQEILERRIKTNIERYGGPSPSSNKEVQEKIRQTNRERYGADYYTQTEEYRNYMDREEFAYKHGISKETYRVLRSKEKLEKELSECGMSAIIFSEKHNITSTTAYRWIHEHGIKGVIRRSSQEIKIEKLLDVHDIPYEINNRIALGDGTELDIYSEQLKFAVECNGNFFHSYNPNNIFFQGRSDKNYHRKKLEAAEVAGIRLMQFFEDEINDKFDIVASMILNAVGKSERIHARKTEAKIIDSKSARAFCEANHINGYTQSRLQIGLYRDDDLVSVMTFSPSRYEKRQGAWEIVRFCSILNHTVVGGASKLIAAARKVVGPEMECLITYADLMHGTGNGYKACGFKEIGRTEAGYFWYEEKKQTRESRQKYQRHKLEKVFNEVFPKEMTENDIMFSKGYRKLYNAGNAKFILEF